MIETILLIALIIIGVLTLIIFYLIKLSIDQRALIHRLSNEIRNLAAEKRNIKEGDNG